MRIAFLSFYSGYYKRGVEVWIDELSQRLSNNHEIIIYQAGKLAKSKFSRLINLDVNWQHEDGWASFFKKIYLDYWSRQIFNFTLKAIDSFSKDVPDVLIPTNGGWQTFLCKFFTLRKGGKLVIVGHSGIGWDDYINLWLRPDVFVALTKYQKDWAKKFSLGVRVEQVPNGVNTKTFFPEGKKILLNLPRPIILVVSALSSNKRVDLTVKAVAKLKKASLVVLGRGNVEQREYIANLGRKLLGERFKILEVNHEETPFWYRACDLFTFPSWEREAFGLVVLEAMACNKKVVVNDDPIKREIVGSAGLFCNPLNIDEYASILYKALNTDFGNKPRKQAEKFSWELIACQYEKLLMELCCR